MVSYDPDADTAWSCNNLEKNLWPAPSVQSGSGYHKNGLLNTSLHNNTYTSSANVSFKPFVLL